VISLDVRAIVKKWRISNGHRFNIN